jgi:hypothetical protein
MFYLIVRVDVKVIIIIGLGGLFFLLRWLPELQLIILSFSRILRA